MNLFYTRRMQEKIVALQIRLPEGLHTQIRELSEADDRPLNRTITRLLEIGLEHYRTIALGPIISRWQEDCGLTDEQLADYLGMPGKNLPGLKADHLQTQLGKMGWRAIGKDFPVSIDVQAQSFDTVATRHGALADRLFDIYIGKPPSTAAV